MAFVYRSQNNHPPSTTPGPGNYLTSNENKPQRLHSAPFNKSSARKIFQQSTIPGPADYQIIYSKQNNNPSILQSYNGNLVIYQPNKQSSIFKSKSKRFQQHTQVLPGPTDYSSENIQKHNKKVVKTQNSLHKYIKNYHKSKINRQSLIQGIISQIQPKQKHSSFIKPQKTHIPFNSLVEKQYKIRPQTSVGPGSYNLSSSMVKQSKNNQQHRFSNNSQKYKRIQTSEKQQKGLQRQTNYTEIKSTIIKQSFNKKQQFFGSGVPRFKQQFVQVPGPGYYQNQIKPSKTTIIVPKRAQTPVHYVFKKINTSEFISPFSYIQSFQQKTENKRKGKEIQSFGSTNPRFKNEKNIQEKQNKKLQINIKPNENITHKSIKRKKQNKHNNFQTKIQNQAKIDQRPLCYDVYSKTIQSNISEKKQIKAPFNSYVSRFDNYNQKQTNLVQQLLQNYQQKQNKQKTKKSSIKSKGIMQSKSIRFNNISYNDRSPCTYDPIKIGKKQFNKLFL